MSERKTIFVVTVLHLKNEAPDTSAIKVSAELSGERRRCWGWYSRLEDAERAVIEHHTDMFEAAYYTHAVIEEMPEGIIPHAKSEHWFEATYEKGGDGFRPRVTRIEKPASMAQTIGFGMG